MGFVVEITSRSGRVIERHYFDQDVVDVGRAYDNDVILSDPYVNAHHVRISSDHEGFAVQRIEIEGRTQLDKQELTQNQTAITSGAALTLGRTHLRVLSSHHPVEPTLTFEWLDQLFSVLTRPLPLVLCFIAYLVIELGNNYMSTYREIEFAAVAVQFLTTLVGMFVWATLWAVITRISRGETRFFHHWLAMLFFSILTILFERLSEVVAFNTAVLSVVAGLGYVATGITLAFLFSLSLRFAFRQSRGVRQAFAQGAAWSFVGYTILSSLSFDDRFRSYPEFEGTLLPMNFLFTTPIREEVFLGEVEALFEFENKEKN